MKTLIFVLALLFAMPAMSQDCNVVVKKQVAAVYPDSAREKGIEGTVYVTVEIGKDGLVRTAMVSKTDDELLNEAALNAIIRWEFKPLEKECKITIPIKFKLAK